MANLPNRTAKDEREYEANIRREANIKTEVIAELRDQNRRLLESQSRLLLELIRATDALRAYRESALQITDNAIKAQSHCVHGCRKHRWDDADGWHRTDE